MSPVSAVFQTVVTVRIGLKNLTLLVFFQFQGTRAADNQFPDQGILILIHYINGGQT